MSYSNSPKQSSSSHGSASEQYIKIVQQLIDSDEDEQILKKMNELQHLFPVLKKMNNNLTNLEKLNIFLRDHTFRMRLTQRLRESGHLFTDPIIKIHLYTIRHRCQIVEELNQHDLETTFQKYGTLETLLFNKNLAYFKYDSYISCYAAIKILNGFEVSDTLRLSVSWCDNNDYLTLSQHYAASVNDSSVVKKSMARYDIYLEINSQFQLSKKIIGPKGVNMKKILNAVLEKNKIPHLDLHNSIAKLRLRGKGSGFKEGWNHAQSDEQLNLCVSSRNNEVFINLCQECQKLLFKIGCDFKEYYFKIHNKQCQGIIYRKFILKKNQYQMNKQLNLQQVNNALDFIVSAAQNRKLKQKDILKFIAMRDKARKQGRFSQSDEIRQHLARQGVILIDQKHASGKQVKTTWKYF